MKAIFKIALPVMVQALVQYILVFTDTAFISQYSLSGLSAIQSALSPYFTLLSVFSALITGLTIIAAQDLGAKRPARARATVAAAFLIHSAISFGYGALWLFGGEGVLRLVGAQGDVLTQGLDYVKTLAWIFTVLGFGLTAGAVFQARGRTFPLMIVSLLKSGLNVLLDWLWIFGNAGFPEWGMAGAAAATVVSEVIGTVVLAFWLFAEKGFPLGWADFRRPRLGLYLRVWRVGLPAGLEYMLWSFGQTVLIGLLNRVDTLYAGFYGLVNLLLNFSVNMYIGFSAAALTLVGQATGAKDARAVLVRGNLAVGITLGVCLVTGAMYLAFPQQILSLFSQRGDLEAVFLPLMGLIVLTTFPKGVNVVVGSAIRATGDTRWMLYTQIGGTVFVIGAALLVLHFKGSLAGLVWVIFFDELLRGVLNQIRFVWPHRLGLKAQWQIWWQALRVGIWGSHDA